MKNLLTLLLLIIVFQVSAQEFSYKEKKELKGYHDYIMQAGFSPFRNYFAITIGNNTIEIYDKDWNKIYSHQGNPKSVGGHFAFSPDEKYLAYAKYKSDNDIAIIRLEDKKVIQILRKLTHIPIVIGGYAFSFMPEKLMKYLGVDTIVWLEKGIDGDDTDGHIDDFARFINKDTIGHIR